MTSGQETEWIYSYNPGAHTGPHSTNHCCTNTPDPRLLSTMAHHITQLQPQVQQIPIHNPPPSPLRVRP